METGSSDGQAHVSPGELWVTCLNVSNGATLPATASAVSTATTPVAHPTSTPQPHATAAPKPTNTPAPSCHSIVTGSGSMNVDNTYLNVDSSVGIGHTLSGAQAQWNSAASALFPVNGAGIDDLGALGSGKYSGFTCASLESASYIARMVPVGNGEVFLVKTPGGQFAKALITLTPGNASPPLIRQTYQP